MIDVQPGEYCQTVEIYFKLRILCYSNSFAFLKDYEILNVTSFLLHCFHYILFAYCVCVYIDHTVSENRRLLLPSCDLASLTC